jgi:hypothetical protein
MDSAKDNDQSKSGWTKVARRTSRERTPKTDRGQLIRQKSPTSPQSNASTGSLYPSKDMKINKNPGKTKKAASGESVSSSDTTVTEDFGEKIKRAEQYCAKKENDRKRQVAKSHESVIADNPSNLSSPAMGTRSHKRHNDNTIMANVSSASKVAHKFGDLSFSQVVKGTSPSPITSPVVYEKDLSAIHSPSANTRSKCKKTSHEQILSTMLDVKKKKERSNNASEVNARKPLKKNPQSPALLADAGDDILPKETTHSKTNLGQKHDSEQNVSSFLNEPTIQIVAS